MRSPTECGEGPTKGGGAGSEPSGANPKRNAEQVARESSQRDAALGRRISAISSGQFGPVLKRWVNATVEPVAARLRQASEAYLARDYFLFASLLDSPLFELSATDRGASSSLAPLLQWACSGSAPGRASLTATYADDIALAVLGTVLLRLARQSKDPPTLTAVLSAAGEAARECVIGQWITEHQGASALDRVRRHDRDEWAQLSKLNQISGLMLGQVKAALDSAARGEIELKKVGRAAVSLEVQTKGRPRMITLKAPTEDAWKVLLLAHKPKGERDPKRELWISLALLVLCAAQLEAGWFDITSTGDRKRGKRAPHRLVLSDEAHRAIQNDVERWLHLGFTNDPMLVPPEEGDYLTVKREAVTGRQGPMGYRTTAENTEHWKTACEVLADTAWTVNVPLLQSLKHDALRELPLKACAGDETTLTLIEAAHRREAAHEFYLPIYMDFRGRLYPRTSWVSYQGNDLQKGLLCFPESGVSPADYSRDTRKALALHLSSVFGGPNKLDKAPLPERYDAFKRWEYAVAYGTKIGDSVIAADEPMQFAAATMLMRVGQWDRIPVQMDGTCNGLQHLSAMFRDEQAAPFVNLCASSWEDRPADIYQVVADRLLARLDIVRLTESWAARLLKSNVTIDRKLCKRPVMVLPYGGTLSTIEDALHAGIVEQNLIPRMWKECETMDNVGGIKCDLHAVQSGYLAFKDRDLAEHPLFRSDVHHLAVTLWECIRMTIPKAMHAMESLRKLGKHLKEDALTWQCNFGDPALEVVHAYPKSAANTLKLRGLHLGGAVRGLKINRGRDEIDPSKHVTGIVANFIHSQDATHLVRTMQRFRAAGGTSFGSVHDCLMCRPTEWEKLSKAVRVAFVNHYDLGISGSHPLEQPVKLTDIKSGTVRRFPSWHALCTYYGVGLPEPGVLDIKEVLESAWFFS